MARNARSVKSAKPSGLLKWVLRRDEKVLFETTRDWTTWGWITPFTWIGKLVIIAATYDGVPEILGRIPHIGFGADDVIGVVTEGSVWASIYFGGWGFYILSKLTEWVLMQRTLFAVTDERVITAKWATLFRRQYSDLPLSSVDKVDVVQTLGERILGYGKVRFGTKAPGSWLEWVGVSRPMSVREAAEEALDMRGTTRP